ncbi:MAG: nucleotidyltransferase substrate binding protein [Puniceicoccales bacterium]|nr:nucleotidyltransferase substrate binding protein [Puniceicoccales bacterium]
MLKENAIAKIIENIDFCPLLKARDFLDYAIRNTKDDLDRAGCIQAFEFCYELAWKFMRRLLIAKGISEEKLAANPKNTFRIAAENYLIQNLEQWFVFILNRNLTVHTYNIQTAKEVYKVIPCFLQELNFFLNTVTRGHTDTDK